MLRNVEVFECDLALQSRSDSVKQRERIGDLTFSTKSIRIYIHSVGITRICSFAQLRNLPYQPKVKSV